ncbi:MAG TPA: hypothetical protein VFW53_03315, partial [Gallionella sp.]|nr:hypothetical protein [Gallionella sp.]
AMRDFAVARNIRYISSLDILCNSEGCLTRTAEDALDITTMDSGHLTPQGARYQAKSVLMDLLNPQARR